MSLEDPGGLSYNPTRGDSALTPCPECAKPSEVERRRDNVQNIRIALQLLSQAQRVLKSAGCRQAWPKVRRVRKSVEGAERHAIRMLSEVETDAEVNRSPEGWEEG